MKKGDSFKTSRKRKRQHSGGSVDFEQLAKKYPEFEEQYRRIRSQQTSGQSFSSLVNQDFNIALTRALVYDKFGLYLPRLPSDRLCPPVPNRLAYVRWIQHDLLPLLSNADYFETKTVSSHCGIDIGAGASCIYPLLFCASAAPDKSTAWKILASEVDSDSAKLAQANVDANNLGDNIHVALVAPTSEQRERFTSKKEHTWSGDEAGISGGPVLRAMEALPNHPMWKCTETGSSSQFDFLMTNPPFYDDKQSTERTDPRAGDDRDRIPMTANEGSYPGGEVGFVLDIMRDSLVLQHRVSWYTSMLGKKSSFVKLKRMLEQLLGPGHVQSTEITTGQMTRWFLAWTFSRPRIESPAARVSGGLKNFDAEHGASSAIDAVSEVADRICAYCRSISRFNLSCTVTSDGTRREKMCIKVFEEDSAPCSSTIDEAKIEESFRKRLMKGGSKDWSRNDLLPAEGHFRINLVVTPRCQGLNASTAGDQGNMGLVSVCLDCFRHSARGGIAIDKIRSQLEGEVCRTNRKWRRIQKRHGEDSSTRVVDAKFSAI